MSVLEELFSLDVAGHQQVAVWNMLMQHTGKKMMDQRIRIMDITVIVIHGRIKKPFCVTTATAAEKDSEQQSGENGSYWDLF